MNQSNSYDKATLNISLKENYAIVQLDNGKVNAISTQLLKDLISTFTELDKDENIKGAILSGRPHAFSAGLDVKEIAMMNEAQSLDFWENYMLTMRTLVNFSKPLVSAITGYAPAGATILVLCTDYRVMGKGDKHVIGMHEFKMQMQIPEMLCDVYAYYLGEVKAWNYIQKAQLFNSDEALVTGLVDESVEVEEVLERAEKHLKKQIAIFYKVFGESKKFFRKGLYRIVNDRDITTLAKEFLAFNNDPELKQMVFQFMMQLQKKA